MHVADQKTYRANCRGRKHTFINVPVQSQWGLVLVKDPISVSSHFPDLARREGQTTGKNPTPQPTRIIPRTITHAAGGVGPDPSK